MSGTHPLVTVETILMVAIGGFAGSNLRYFVELVVPSSLLATLAVNAFGSFALAVIVYESTYAGVLSEQASLVFATGFLSSFTTYGTFALDVVTAPEYALAYVAASYALGFAGVYAGRYVAVRLEGIQ